MKLPELDVDFQPTRRVRAFGTIQGGEIALPNFRRSEKAQRRDRLAKMPRAAFPPVPKDALAGRTWANTDRFGLVTGKIATANARPKFFPEYLIRSEASKVVGCATTDELPHQSQTVQRTRYALQVSALVHTSAPPTMSMQRPSMRCEVTTRHCTATSPQVGESLVVVVVEDRGA